jgi:hypothetical protein
VPDTGRPQVAETVPDAAVASFRNPLVFEVVIGNDDRVNDARSGSAGQPVSADLRVEDSIASRGGRIGRRRVRPLGRPLADVVPRTTLTRIDTAVTITATTYVPINMIPHTHGKAKRFALCNNLAVDADVVHYYTDTDPRSSHSPVLDDRSDGGAAPDAMRQTAEFQAKETAFVNVRPEMARVVVDLRQQAPVLCAELALRLDRPSAFRISVKAVRHHHGH